MPRLSICSSICCHDTHAVLRCSPVGHAHDDAVHAPPAGHVDQGLQSGDQRLAALQAEALLRRPLPLQELLEPGGPQGDRASSVGAFRGLLRGGLQGPPLHNGCLVYMCLFFFLIVFWKMIFFFYSTMFLLQPNFPSGIKKGALMFSRDSSGILRICDINKTFIIHILYY